MVHRVINTVLLLIAIAISLFALLYNNPGTQTDADTVTGTLQYSTPELLTVPDYIWTNTNASNAVFALRQYETNVPWLTISNNRIWSGLYNRQWSQEYDVGTKKNSADIIIGAGLYGVQYRYNFWRDFYVGGVLAWDGENIKAAGTLGWQW